MNESEINANDAASKPARLAKMSAEKALPKSGSDTLVKIIKGYAVSSNGGESQVNYKDVASAAGVAPTSVSGNNNFLLEAQILTSPKYGYYVPSEGAVRFARETAWDEASAKSHLRKIIVNSWFGQVVIQNFTLRSNLSRGELKRSLAIKCGATEGDTALLEFLLDFIIYTGLVIENENGTLTKGNFDEIANPVGASLVVGRQTTEAKDSFELKHEVDPAPQQRPMSSSAVTFVIHLHMNDSRELTPEHALRVKEWIRQVRHDDAGSDLRVEIDSPASDS